MRPYALFGMHVAAAANPTKDKENDNDKQDYRHDRIRAVLRHSGARPKRHEFRIGYLRIRRFRNRYVRTRFSRDRLGWRRRNDDVSPDAQQVVWSDRQRLLHGCQRLDVTLSGPNPDELGIADRPAEVAGEIGLPEHGIQQHRRCDRVGWISEHH
jgi:hypothetical protein